MKGTMSDLLSSLRRVLGAVMITTTALVGTAGDAAAQAYPGGGAAPGGGGGGGNVEVLGRMQVPGSGGSSGLALTGSAVLWLLALAGVLLLAGLTLRRAARPSS